MNRQRIQLRSTIVLLVVLFVLGLVACRSQEDGLPDALYLDWDPSGRIQLFRADVDGEQPSVQLTGVVAETSGDVTTFNVAPDGAHIAYSLLFDEGGSEIRLITVANGEDELLVACPDAECGEPSWSPDNRRLAYERREITGTATGQARLWWLDSATGETIPLVEADDGPAYGASFSPDGQWLAYVSTKNQGLVVVNLLDGYQRLIDSESGMPPRWSLDSQSLIFSDREVVILHGADDDNHDAHSHDTGTAVRLYLQALTDDATVPQRLSPDSLVDDSAPSLSPDGQWLTFGRRVADTASARQIWIMQTDGSEARALSAEPTQNYGPALWSPDGRYLLYQRFPLFESDAEPTVWVMNVETGAERQIAESGFTPQWLPKSD